MGTDATTRNQETTSVDLLRAQTLEMAAAAAGWPQVSPDVRAVWTAPIEGEEDAPERRIIHSRLLRLHAPARLDRLGLRRTMGYSKCGSRVQLDWPTSFRLLVWDGSRWGVERHESDLAPPADESTQWFDLGGISAGAAIIELRRCHIDNWWTSWNLAAGGVILEGSPESESYPRKESRLRVEGIDRTTLPPGVRANHLPGEVRFTTAHFEVGFQLGRAGFSYFAIDQEGSSQNHRNLLRVSPVVALQGLRFHPLGAPPLVAPLLRHDVTGSVAVRGNTITYAMCLPDAGQEYRISWEVRSDGMAFSVSRKGQREMRVWDGSAWTIACDSEVTPTTVLGKISRSGETGALGSPALFHAPGHGTLRLTLSRGDGLLRSDSHRPLTFTTLALKVGEIPQAEGDYLLQAGTTDLEGFWEPYRVSPPLGQNTPVQISLALERCALTALSYRADTATLSNNGNSMHAPLCMDNWSAVATRLGKLVPGLEAVDLLRDTLQRWLDGAPGYASGGFAGEEGLHLAEDEYVMTGTAALLGLGEYLAHSGTGAWLDAYGPAVKRELHLMQRRDSDQDGLVECPYRDGVSGGHHWSTNWYDVISYGWKDALANALLYRALVLLGQTLPRLGRADLAAGLEEWALRLKASFLPAFFNSATGWLGGWRSRDGRLHDYAFLPVNGEAVLSGVLPQETARSLMHALWSEASRVGLPDVRLGLPGNLWPVAEEDMVELMHGKPMGYYLNGGLTHSQSLRFVGALYRVGMTREADTMLEGLCASLADGSAFGGCNSGVDWRYWDGGPCGYEGLLTDQFGILAVALERYGLAPEP
jgi:hypothetical protein